MEKRQAGRLGRARWGAKGWPSGWNSAGRCFLRYRCCERCKAVEQKEPKSVRRETSKSSLPWDRDVQPWKVMEVQCSGARYRHTVLRERPGLSQAPEDLGSPGDSVSLRQRCEKSGVSLPARRRQVQLKLLNQCPVGDVCCECQRDLSYFRKYSTRLGCWCQCRPPTRSDVILFLVDAVLLVHMKGATCNLGTPKGRRVKVGEQRSARRVRGL